MIQRKTVPAIRAQKGGNPPLVCLTAYTSPMARILDPHVDILLVGDSVGTVLYGFENTLPVDLDMMIRHGKAVSRAVQRACVVVDMPFGSYEDSQEQAFENAARLIDETGCDAVKLEGGAERASTIAALVSGNIPVMAHIGLQPQSVVKDGGYKVKGRTPAERDRLLNDARAVEQAGAFSIVIEATLADTAALVTRSVGIPTIGIGAGLECDGQILVTEDMLGLLSGHTPRFVKKYAALSSEIDRAAQNFAADIRAKTFPDRRHSYTKPADD